MSKSSKIEAARNMDWQQVVFNGGPPCFHLSKDGRFCGRAERWDGHKPTFFNKKTQAPIHDFVSLADLISNS